MCFNSSGIGPIGIVKSLAKTTKHYSNASIQTYSDINTNADKIITVQNIDN